MISAKEDYERHKKLPEEQKKIKILKRETDLIKDNPNKLQIKVVNMELGKVAKEQTTIEPEKLCYSMIRKVDDDMLLNLADTKANEAKMLTIKQLEQIQWGNSVNI
jgi:hypothetical protein